MPVKVVHRYKNSSVIHDFGYQAKIFRVRAGIIGRLYPTDQFRSKLPQQFGNVRLVWNKFCGWLEKQYRVR